jgi:UDP-3-O-[3-hydroxymyristoyl] glucosamine N-acyltransferase
LKNPSYGWAKVLEILEKERLRPPSGGIHATALVAPTARLGAGVTVGPYVVIEDGAVVGDHTVIQAHGFIGADTTIGRDCLFHPRVTVRERVAIGDRCIFHPGVVIGGDGFGFTVHEGRHYKIPQVGTVEISDDVEIQANSTVDRAASGATRIGRGTKVDNLVQIAHNVEIGEHCLVVALTGIAGSTKLGRYVTLGAQVGIAGHLNVGDFVQAGARSGISHDIKAKEIIWGTPAQPLKDELRTLALFRRLPDLFEEIKKLKKRMES